MSVNTNPAEGDDGRDVHVDFELTGALVARAGARGGRIRTGGETLLDAIEAWADDHGSHLRFALLKGDRLRSDVVARRVTDAGDERLAAAQPVADGDVIRFEPRGR